MAKSINEHPESNRSAQDEIYCFPIYVVELSSRGVVELVGFGRGLIAVSEIGIMSSCLWIYRSKRLGKMPFSVCQQWVSPAFKVSAFC
jgi:hypothetical protein